MDKRLNYLNIKMDAYLADVGHLSAAELGSYHKLVNYAATHEGRLPRDDEGLRRITGLTVLAWRKVRPQVVGLLAETPDGHEIEMVNRAYNARKQVVLAASDGGKAKSLKYNKTKVPSAQFEAAEGLPNKKEEIRKKDSTEYEDRPSSLTSTSREETVLPPAAVKQYFYENRYIRYNEKDFRRLEQSFPDINIRAELETVIFWDNLNDKNWFHVIPKVLKKKQEEMKKAGGIKWY